MSSKRSTNRKVKAKNQSNKGSATPGSGPLVADESHNQSLPCCRLLRDVAQDIFCTTGDDSSDTTHTRPTSLLGHMLRKLLLEERRKESVSKPGGSEPSSSKKKKKKKKKKANKGAASPVEASSENATPDISPAVIQDPQSQEVPSSAEPTSSENKADRNTSETPSSYSPNPVDAYLDRFQERQQQREQNEEKPLIQRDIDSFVEYLNKKLQGGISVPHSQLEAASQTIACPACRAAVNNLLQQDNRQPIVLNPIQFQGYPTTSNSSVNKESRSTTGSKNHNGLEVPILNQKPAQAQAQAQVQDFDYVALEEGTNPLATMMEVQANVSGIPYFYPGNASLSQASSGATTNGNNKKQNKGSEPAEVQPQLEWRFVPASATTREPNEQVGEAGNNKVANQINVQDLKHVVKDVMVPLALSPDELMGAHTGLGNPELEEIFERVQELEKGFNKELHHARNEADHYGGQYNELWKDDSENNLEFKKAPAYHDLDDAIHSVLQDVIIDIIWDRLLWLCGTGNTVVIRPTPMWENIVVNLTELSVRTILGMMQAVETFEHELEDMANSQGMIPHLFVSKPHRQSYRAMIEHKLQLVMNLIEQVRRASLTLEPAMVGGEDALPPQTGTKALVVAFRRKWFTQQEFYRQVEKQQKREGLSSPVRKHSNKDNSLTEGNPSENANTQNSEMPLSDRWIQTLDIYGVDLLRGLLDLSKTIRRGRIYEIKEEHLVRCQKLVGFLYRVGFEVLRPLAEEDENDSLSNSGFRLLDDSLRKQCETIWSQIQQQRDYLHAVLQGQEAERPVVDEQKQIVAKTALDAIRLLRQLRKYVTVHYGPAAPPPIMPLKLVAWMTPTTHNAGFASSGSDFYDSLVSAAALAEMPLQQRCLGSGGQCRIKSLLLALFYQKLSDQCSEWHAELAEQELLTAMNTGDNILNGGSSATNKNSKDADVSQNKATKKSKKKKDKKAAATEPNVEVRKETPKSEGEAIASRSGAPTLAKKDTDIANNIGFAQEMYEATEEIEKQNDADVKQLKNENVNEGRVEKRQESSEDEPWDNIDAAKEMGEALSSSNHNGGNKVSAGRSGNAKSKNGKGKKRNESGGAYKVEGSFNAVDMHLGVRDGAGEFHTAESYLVGKLTVILQQANADYSHGRNAASKGNGVVVIM